MLKCRQIDVFSIRAFGGKFPSTASAAAADIIAYAGMNPIPSSLIPLPIGKFVYAHHNLLIIYTIISSVPVPAGSRMDSVNTYSDQSAISTQPGLCTQPDLVSKLCD